MTPRFVSLLLLLGSSMSLDVRAQESPRAPSADPDQARIVSDDVSRFWEAYDTSAPKNRAAVLQTEYLDRASPGLKAFLEQRIESADLLARLVDSHPRYFSSARESTLRLASFEPEIRAAFYRLEELYPDAVFPDVYFVIGRMNSGGITAQNGLVIGAEMYGRTDDMPLEELDEWRRTVLARPERVPGIVAHELVHYQQKGFSGKPTLLSASLGEGTADFVAELIAGYHINHHVHEWADTRESELWEEYRERMLGDDYTGWLYNGNAADGRPADLGYWMGYRIVQSYYDRSEDKAAALANILLMDDAEEFLNRSGYGR